MLATCNVSHIGCAKWLPLSAQAAKCPRVAPPKGSSVRPFLMTHIACGECLLLLSAQAAKAPRVAPPSGAPLRPLLVSYQIPSL